jgi:hypothetical protein
MTTTIPAAHWAAGLHAVADHMLEHQLPIPTEIAPDPASRFGGPALDIRVAYEHLPTWLNSLTVRDETAEHITTVFGDRARLAFKAVLPATGVRIDLLTSYGIDGAVSA